MSWNKKIYIANKKIITDKNGIDMSSYDVPIEYNFNYQPASGESDITLYGERILKMYKAIIPIIYKNKFKEEDIAWIGEIPNLELDNYNYRIESVRPQNKKIAIYFNRIQK